jgi:hypothetical protein
MISTNGGFVCLIIECDRSIHRENHVRFALKRKRPAGGQGAEAPRPAGRYRAGPDVLETERDGHRVLLDLRGNRYWELDETASTLWHQLARGLTLEQAVEAMTTVYDAPAEEIRADAESLVGHLLRLRLVEEERA